MSNKISKYDMCDSCRRLRIGSDASEQGTGWRIEEILDNSEYQNDYMNRLINNNMILHGVLSYENQGCASCIRLFQSHIDDLKPTAESMFSTRTTERSIPYERTMEQSMPYVRLTGHSREPKNSPLMTAFKAFWTNYINFSGHTDRSEFWLGFLSVFLLSGVVMFIASRGFTALYYLWSLAIAVPLLSMSVRRLRDAGFHWAWIFINLIPSLGTLVFIVLCCLPSKTT